MKFVFKLSIFISIMLSIALAFENKFTHVDLGNGQGKIKLNHSIYIEDSANGYKRLVQVGGGHLAEIGMPELPQFTTFYQLDPSIKYDFKFEVLESYFIDDIEILPHQGMEKWEVENISSIDQNIYNSFNPFPVSNMSISDPVQGRGIQFVSIQVVPYKYYPKNRKLEVYSEINIIVEEIGYNDNFELNQPKRSHIFDNYYKNLIVNFEASDRPEDYQASTILYIGGGDWLNNSYVQDLLLWRHKQGYIVHAVSTSEIGASNGNENTIKNYIQEAYLNWENPPEIVGLIGDTNVIDCFYQPWGSGGWNSYNGASDTEYSLLDGNDLIPEVFIGRISGQGQSVMENVVNKTIQYEKALYVSDDWFNRAALVGDPTQSGNSTIFTSQYIENIMINYGMTGVETDYDGQGLSNWIIDQFQDGILYYNYRGIYGDTGTSPSNQYNNGYQTPFATVMTCGTGDFDEGNSQTESFVKLGSVSNPEGAVAAIGLSTTGTHTAYNNIIDMGIYHGIFVDKIWYAGGALASGDLAMIATYPSNPGNATEAFTGWSNLIGDPALHLWSSVPDNFVVDHVENISLGTTTTDIIVYNEDGETVEGAKVTLLMGDDIIFSTGLTNENGEITLNWSNVESGQVFITVIKRNHKPYEGSIEILSDLGSAVSVLPQAYEIISGQNQNINFSIKNYGDVVAEDISINLSSDYEHISILNSVFDIGNVNVEEVVEIIVPVYVHTSGFYLDDVILQFNINDKNGNNWTSNLFLDLIGPNLELVDYNGDIFPGSSTYLDLKFKNSGNLNLRNYSIDLLPSLDFYDLNSSSFNISELLIDQKISLNEFNVTFDANIINGAIIPLEVLFTGSDGFSRKQVINLTVGEVREGDPLGPDAYGYYIYDNGDVDYSLAPQYDWIEIADGLGEQLNLVDYGDGNYAGSYTYSSELIDLPFTFTFYGIDYDQIVVNTNGWISFGDFIMYSFRNYPIPGAGGPSPMVAAFWDDLRTGSGGYVHYYSTDDKVVIQWDDMRTYDGGSRETFQIILYNKEFLSPTITGDSELKIQYQEFNNTSDGYYPNGDTPTHGCYSTVGIENHLGDIGLGYTFNNQYPDAAPRLVDGSALWVTTGKMPRVSLSIENVDLVNGLLDIYIDNQEDVAGFQFEILGVDVLEASGGLSSNNDFLVSTSNSSVLGFSISGTTIPAGSGLLTEVSFTNFQGDEICFGTDPVNNVVSNVFGNILETTWGACFESSFMLGDLNGDGLLDILDLVTLASLILDNGFNPIGDINQDGHLDVLDIVNLINMILD